ncbi:MAG: Rne/Rng family ribonuclease [Acidobacteria bacterium]|nr:Rne/Rng family ribonuclease [Acidobacteriota bacterium]
MTKELVISANSHETKVALLEDDQLVEIFFQRLHEYSLAGSVHKGRVTRVLPGMQSAFVNLGLERDTFLYVSDFFEESDEYEKLPEEKPARRQAVAEPKTLPAPAPAIEQAAEIAKPAAAAPAAAGAGERAAQDDERGDRRGRRGRRRGRGQGFPNSKYADSRHAPPQRYLPPRHAERPEPAESAKVAGSAESAPAPQADFAVLPGESLAKYSRPGASGEVMADQAGEPAMEAAATPAGAAAEPDRQDLAQQAMAQAIEEPESVASEGLEEAEDGLTEEQLDQIQEEAEEYAYSGAAGAPAESGESGQQPEPAQQAVPSGQIEQAEPGELAAGEAAEELAEEIAAAAGQAGEPAAAPPEPALASVESIGSSHREQTSRFARGPRMRRRRGPPEEKVKTVGRERDRERDRERPPQASISELLKEGHEIVVQISKEPLGQKGARITSHIALPGRYCVYMPTVEHLGVSRRIASDEERSRLRRILQTHRQGIPGGFIMRTAGEGKSEEQIAADMQYLSQLWQEIKSKADRMKAPALLYHDVEIVQRLLRDQLTDQFKAIWVDHEEVYESVVRFVQRMQPSMVPRVKLYTRDVPIFDAFNITSELEKALRPKVWLKTGGYIVINQTEALVAIDVNTGKFVGKSHRLEDTIVKANTDAVKEIVRQIRLRDLGGIIVVDFIDMDERKNRQRVMQAIEEAMRADRAPYKILQFNDFGLVAITRKRVKQSLERALCAPCPTCDGSGYTKSVQTVIGEILVESQKLSSQIEGKEVMLRVHPGVALALKSRTTDYLEELEEMFKRPVLVTSDAALHPEKFDIT